MVPLTSYLHTHYLFCLWTAYLTWSLCVSDYATQTTLQTRRKYSLLDTRGSVSKDPFFSEVGMRFVLWSWPFWCFQSKRLSSGGTKCVCVGGGRGRLFLLFTLNYFSFYGQRAEISENTFFSRSGFFFLIRPEFSLSHWGLSGVLLVT